jgi:hypothetical protein
VIDQRCTHLPPSLRRVPLDVRDSRSRVWKSHRVCVQCHAYALEENGLLTAACGESCGDVSTHLIITLMRCDECGQQLNALDLHGDQDARYALPVRVSPLCIRNGVLCRYCMEQDGLIQAVTIVSEVDSESVS